jgi:hypothetical protein
MTAATKTGQAADGELGGLLGRLTKVLEGALEGELDAHLGMRSTTRPAAMAGTPATGTGPRP